MSSLKDLTGLKFGRLTVLCRTDNKNNRTMWECLCDCGNKKIVSSSNLIRGNTLSCGCLRNEKRKDKQYGVSFDDLSGKRFGRLIVIKRDQEYIDKAGRHRYKYKCLCDCGNITYVIRQHLLSGRVQSCGCLHKESASKRGKQNATHGGNRRNVPYEEIRLYNIWKGMKQRCFNPRNSSYKDWGGRGIRVCDEWLNFSTFQKWALNHGYNSDLSIDRIDVNKGYSPDNCRWATKVEQMNNTRANKIVSIDGISHTVAEWSRISGIKVGTISSRIKNGWPIKDAVYKPVVQRKETQ